MNWTAFAILALCLILFLGRYGDPLNPWGDVITIAQAWCASTPEVTSTLTICKPLLFFQQAYLVLGVPTDVKRKDGSQGKDTIVFNAHRYKFDIFIFISQGRR